jgi:hypothetical protein
MPACFLIIAVAPGVTSLLGCGLQNAGFKHMQGRGVGAQESSFIL